MADEPRLFRIESEDDACYGDGAGFCGGEESGMASHLREVEVQVVGPDSMTGPTSCYAGECEAGFGFEPGAQIVCINRDRSDPPGEPYAG